jgi:hypothetical protein
VSPSPGLALLLGTGSAFPGNILSDDLVIGSFFLYFPFLLQRKVLATMQAEYKH